MRAIGDRSLEVIECVLPTITAPFELIEHQLMDVGHRDLLVTRYFIPFSTMLSATRATSAAPAASFKCVMDTGFFR